MRRGWVDLVGLDEASFSGAVKDDVGFVVVAWKDDKSFFYQGAAEVKFFREVIKRHDW